MKMFIILSISICIAQLFLPWWIIIPISLVFSYLFNKKPLTSFLICFLSVYCVWVAYSLYISYLNGHLLGNRIGVLLGLPESTVNWIWIAVISGLPGGIVAGFSGLSGQYLKKVF